MEVLVSFHCTEMTKLKNLNDLLSWTTASEHTSVSVIFEIKLKMGVYVYGAVDCSTGPFRVALSRGGSLANTLAKV